MFLCQGNNIVSCIISTLPLYKPWHFMWRHLGSSSFTLLVWSHEVELWFHSWFRGRAGPQMLILLGSSLLVCEVETWFHSWYRGRVVSNSQSFNQESNSLILIFFKIFLYRWFYLWYLVLAVFAFPSDDVKNSYSMQHYYIISIAPLYIFRTFLRIKAPRTPLYSGHFKFLQRPNVSYNYILEVTARKKMSSFQGALNPIAKCPEY